MTTDNPAHAARIKCTDNNRSVSYVHWRNGWTCTLDHGLSAAMSYAGIPHNQEMACKFALADCQSPTEVLAVVQRYGSGAYRYELLGVPPSLSDRLTAIIDEARMAGYAVVSYTPYELVGIDPEALEQHLLLAGRAFIATFPEPEED
jgi:hypothetical protein